MKSLTGPRNERRALGQRDDPLPRAAFGDPDELRAEGIDIDIDEMWEPAALHRICAAGRWDDGTFLSAIMHTDGVPQEVLDGCREHGLVEFTNLVRVAREGILAARTA
ncbi:hypothetical protein [Streptomyces sp. NPDC002588]|uniref:hypothetical protein n=1 Tax=Streptomyces sp. NPDC002588 TaxID=3154419 RepID=UPI003333EDE0